MKHIMNRKVFAVILLLASPSLATDIKGLILTGSPPISNMTMTNNTVTMNTTSVRLGYVFQATATDPITHIGVSTASITGTTAQYKVSLQGVNTSGLPDGTIKGGGSPASLDNISESVWGTNTFVWNALANSYSPSVGEWLAVVVEPGSGGTIDGSNFITVNITSNLFGASNKIGAPYVLSDANATWALADKLARWGLLAAKGSAVYYGYPLAKYGVSTYSGTSEVGVRFTLPAGMASSIGVKGVRWYGKASATGQTINVTLYADGETSPTIISQISVDSDFVSGASVADSAFDIYFQTPQIISPGVVYHIGLSCSGGTSPDLRYVQAETADDLSALPGGAWIYAASRVLTDYPPSGNDSNAFASSSTQQMQRPLVELILSDITGGAQGVIGG